MWVAETVAQIYRSAGEDPHWNAVYCRRRALQMAQWLYGKVYGEILKVNSMVLAHRRYLHGTIFKVVAGNRTLCPLYNHHMRDLPTRVTRPILKPRGL